MRTIIYLIRNNIEDKEQAAILARIRTILTEDKEKPAQKKKSAAGGKRISVVGRKRVQASPKKEEPEKPLEEDSVPQIETNIVRKPAPSIYKIQMMRCVDTLEVFPRTAIILAHMASVTVSIVAAGCIDLF